MGADMAQLTRAEREYLSMGKRQRDGKLPLFDEDGQLIATSTVKSCVEKGLIERWFVNPIRPDWTVCRLTEAGREAL